MVEANEGDLATYRLALSQRMSSRASTIRLRRLASVKMMTMVSLRCRW